MGEPRFNRFGDDLGTPLGTFRHRVLKLCFYFGLVFKSLFVPIVVSESGCPALLKQGFRIQCSAKINFPQEFDSGNIRPHFTCFLVVLGHIFYDFWCHGSTLEISWFFRVAQRDP